MTIELAVIGGGRMAVNHHLPALRRLMDSGRIDVRPRALVDSNPEQADKVAGQFGFATTYPSVDALLRDGRPDAALVLTPYWVNETVTAPLLEHGVAVFTEKPPAMSAAGTRRLAELAERAGVANQVGFNRRYWPPIKTALDWLAEHDAPLQAIRATKHRLGRTNEDYAFYTFSHVIDLILAVAGPATSMQCLSAPVPGADSANLFALIRLAGDCSALASGMPDVGYQQEIYEFHTRRGTVIVDAYWGTDRPAIVREYVDYDLVREVVLPRGADRPVIDGFLPQLEAFFDALAGAAPASPTLRDCVQTMELLEALRAGRNWSAGERASEEIPDPALFAPR